MKRIGIMVKNNTRKGYISFISAIMFFLFTNMNCNQPSEPEASPPTNGEKTIVMGYYLCTDNFPMSDINFENLTHVAYAFEIPQADGTLTNLNPKIDIKNEFVKIVKNAGKKAILSIGGESTETISNGEIFSKLTSNENLRKKFIENIAEECVDKEFNGVDIDWEFPQSNDDWNNLVIFIQGLYTSLKNKNENFTLSLAIAGGFRQSYQFDKLNPYIDWYGVMSYGYFPNENNKNTPIQNASLQDVTNNINDYIHIGAPKNKLLMGLPFFGIVYPGILSFEFKFYGTIKSINYCDIQPLLYSDMSQYEFDEINQVPYIVDMSKNELVSYDDEKSIKIKCDEVKSLSIRGTIIWALGQDASTLDRSEQPLLCTVGSELLNSGCNSSQNENIWQNISQGFNSDDNISGMTVDENNNLWINLYNKGVYLSTDGGNSFQMKLSGNGYNNMLTYGQSIVWAQGDFTISKSNDEGSNWTKLPVGSWPDKNAICNYGSDLLYTVAWEGAAWKSIDGGNAWTQIIAPSGKEDYWGVGAANDNVAFIGGNLKDGTSVVYKTIDGGQTWNRAYTGGNNGGIRLLVESSSLVYGVGNNGLIIETTDGGTTWNKLQSSTNETLLNIKQVPNSSIYVAGTNGTILRSDDGINWVKETSGTTVNLEGLAVSKTCIYASGMGTLLKKVIQ